MTLVKERMIVLLLTVKAVLNMNYSQMYLNYLTAQTFVLGRTLPTTQPMTIVGKFFDLSDCCIVYPGFMMHVSNSDWTK